MTAPCLSGPQGRVKGTDPLSDDNTTCPLPRDTWPSPPPDLPLGLGTTWSLPEAGGTSAPTVPVALGGGGGGMVGYNKGVERI